MEPEQVAHPEPEPVGGRGSVGAALSRGGRSAGTTAPLRRVGADDGRAFAAELERQRREIFGRRRHHRPPYARAAGEKNLVKLVLGHLVHKYFPM